MINFFGKTRMKLAADNLPVGKGGRFLKYSRYAIGEIILVVVGILIALQINNWNEDRKLEKRKKEVTLSLALELEDVLSYSKQQLDYLNHRIVYFTKIINEWETLDPKMLSSMDLEYYYFAIHTATLLKYNPKIDYYNSLIGSGEINMIPDSLSVKLNYVYNKEREDVRTYVNQEADLHVLIAEVIAKNHSKEFLTAKVTGVSYNMLDTASIINFLNSIKKDGELKSLIIRNLTIVKWKRNLIENRIIPELNSLKESFQLNMKDE